MSTLPEATPTARSATFAEAPPRGVLVLTGFNIALTAWLLACIGPGLARATGDDAGREVESLAWAERKAPDHVSSAPLADLIALFDAADDPSREVPPITRRVD